MKSGKGNIIIGAFLVAVIIMTSGCSKELSRARALELIKKQGKYPQKMLVNFDAWHDLGPIDGGEIYELSSFEKKLEEIGLAKVKKTEYIDERLSFRPKMLRISYELSKKGKDMLRMIKPGDAGWAELGTFLIQTPQLVGVIGEIIVQQVTGISPAELNAEYERDVEFDILHGPSTELFQLVGLLNRFTPYKAGKKEKRGAILKLYDDGWRVEEIN